MRFGSQCADAISFFSRHRREPLAAGLLSALAAEGDGVRILGHATSQIQVEFYRDSAQKLLSRIGMRADIQHRNDNVIYADPSLITKPLADRTDYGPEFDLKGIPFLE